MPTGLGRLNYWEESQTDWSRIPRPALVVGVKVPHEGNKETKILLLSSFY